MLMGNTILMANLELFSIDFSTIGFTLFNTLLITLAYRFFLHKPVMNILEKRKALINDEISAATEAKEKAETSRQEYMALIADSKSEAAQIISAANTRAQAREEEIIKDAENAATLIRKKAKEDVESEPKRAEKKKKNQITELVIMAAGAVAEKEINEADNTALIESFLVKASQD
jgi:F-type H+-transporting ATPase subunit b